MSIWSEIERLDTEIGKQSDLIDDILVVLDEKSGSEGNVFVGVRRDIEGNTAALNNVLDAANALPEASEPGITPSGEIELTENNKRTDVTNFAVAFVNVPEREPVVTTLNAKENKTYRASDDGVDGYDVVIVDVPVETVETVTVHIGVSEPTSDIGSDGDFYIVRSDAT